MDRCERSVIATLVNTKMTFNNIGGATTGSIDGYVFDPKDVCQVFNTYFSSIAESIGKPDNIKDNESIEYVIESHSNHPSVVLISQSFNVIDTFKFTTVYEVQVEKQIKSVNPKKATGYDQIPPRIIKLCHKECIHTYMERGGRSSS